MNEYSTNQVGFYITGSERHQTRPPRRYRRYRIRSESLLCDCRSGIKRRSEDEEGFLNLKVFTKKDQSQVQNKK